MESTEVGADPREIGVTSIPSEHLPTAYARSGHQRSNRSAQQPDQAHQTDRLRLPELRELPNQGTAPCRQAQLAGSRLDRCPMSRARQIPKILYCKLVLIRRC